MFEGGFVDLAENLLVLLGEVKGLKIEINYPNCRTKSLPSTSALVLHTPCKVH